MRKPNKTHHISVWNSRSNYNRRYQKPTLRKLTKDPPVNLKGFDTIFDPRVSKIRRFVWFVLIVTLSGFSGYQIFNCFHNFLHQHTAVTVDFIKNETFKAPHIIICPLILTKNVKLIEEFWGGSNNTRIPPQDLYNLVGPSRSVQDIWEISDMLAEDLSLEIIEGLSLVDSWIVDKSHLSAKKIYGLSGKCTSIHAERKIVYNGLYTFIRIRNLADLPYKDGTFLQVSVNTESVNHFQDLIVSRQGVIIPLHAQVNLFYSLQEHNLMDTREHPCSNDEVVSKCIDECVERVVYKEEKAECRLPFMDLSAGLPTCETPDQFRKTIEIADRLMKNYSPEFCKCPRLCRTTIYNQKSVSELHVDEDVVLNLNIFFPDNSIQRITEYNSYTISALLSDVGGSLGLYLGICLVTVIEMLETVGLKLAKVINFKA